MIAAQGHYPASALVTTQKENETKMKRYTFSELQHFPRSVQWRIQLGLLSIDPQASSVAACTLQEVYEWNKELVAEQQERYDALVHFDDCHGTGFIGANGKGTHEYRNCLGRVDITTGTLGKALGGASGGYTSAHKEIIALLRQRVALIRTYSYWLS